MKRGPGEGFLIQRCLLYVFISPISCRVWWYIVFRLSDVSCRALTVECRVSLVVVGTWLWGVRCGLCVSVVGCHLSIADCRMSRVAGCCWHLVMGCLMLIVCVGCRVSVVER